MTSKANVLKWAQGSIEYEYEPISGESSHEPVTVFLHHGLVGGAGVLESTRVAARSHNLALVTVSRPGYGGSDPICMNTIGEWAEITRALADHLDVGCFAVGAFSAGAPYAYACAALLGDRVSCVAIHSGLSYLHAPEVLAAYPDASQKAFRRFSKGSIESVRAEIVPLIERWTSNVEPEDPTYRFLRATLASKGIGPGREAWLQMQPWGFDLQSIEQAVRLWHHPKDPQVPYPCAEWMVKELPNAHLIALDGPQTHGPSEASMDMMLSWISKRATS